MDVFKKLDMIENSTDPEEYKHFESFLNEDVNEKYIAHVDNMTVEEISEYCQHGISIYNIFDPTNINKSGWYRLSYSV